MMRYYISVLLIAFLIYLYLLYNYKVISPLKCSSIGPGWVESKEELIFNIRKKLIKMMPFPEITLVMPEEVYWNATFHAHNDIKIECKTEETNRYNSLFGVQMRTSHLRNLTHILGCEKNYGGNTLLIMVFYSRGYNINCTFELPIQSKVQIGARENYKVIHNQITSSKVPNPLLFKSFREEQNYMIMANGLIKIISNNDTHGTFNISFSDKLTSFDIINGNKNISIERWYYDRYTIKIEDNGNYNFVFPKNITINVDVAFINININFNHTVSIQVAEYSTGNPNYDQIIRIKSKGVILLNDKEIKGRQLLEVDMDFF